MAAVLLSGAACVAGRPVNVTARVRGFGASRAARGAAPPRGVSAVFTRMDEAVERRRGAIKTEVRFRVLSKVRASHVLEFFFISQNQTLSFCVARGVAARHGREAREGHDNGHERVKTDSHVYRDTARVFTSTCSTPPPSSECFFSLGESHKHC
jgi:hypothetical protein